MLNNSSSSEVTSNADGTTTTVFYTIDAQFSVAHSVDDIGQTDKVVAIVDRVTGASSDKQTPAAGVTSQAYGRLAYIEDMGKSSTTVQLAYHEVGHQLGFVDHFEGNKKDPMDYNGRLYQGNKFTGSEMKAIYDNNTSYPDINHGFNKAIITNRQNNGVTNNTSTNARPYIGDRKFGMHILMPIKN